MPKFQCFGPASQDSDDHPNTYTKRRRFSLTRSFSFSDAFYTKNMRRVSSFFKTIKKRGSGNSSTGSAQSSANTDEDYGSAWAYYPNGGRIIRVHGVDFEMVPPPSARSQGAFGSSQPSPQRSETLANSPCEPSEFGGYRSQFTQNAAGVSSARRRPSAQSLIEGGCSERAIDSLETQELRRQASLDSQLKYFEAAWKADDDLGTFYRPGSIYEQMLGIDAEIDALLKQQIYNLNFPEHPLFHRDVLSPHPTGAAENGIGNNSENLEANSKPKHRIPRKPVPAF